MIAELIDAVKAGIEVNPVLALGLAVLAVIVIFMANEALK
jgi:hypothetical protein